MGKLYFLPSFLENAILVYIEKPYLITTPKHVCPLTNTNTNTNNFILQHIKTYRF